jgi:hypothetical protein
VGAGAARSGAGPRCELRAAICDVRYVVCDMWCAICDMRYAVCDMRYAICEMRDGRCVVGLGELGTTGNAQRRLGGGAISPRAWPRLDRTASTHDAHLVYGWLYCMHVCMYAGCCGRRRRSNAYTFIDVDMCSQRRPGWCPGDVQAHLVVDETAWPLRAFYRWIYSGHGRRYSC